MDYDRITLTYDSDTDEIVAAEEIQRGYATDYREIRFPRAKSHWGTIKLTLRDALGQGLVADCMDLEEVSP